MKRQPMIYCFILALALLAAGGTAQASPCTWGADLPSLTAFGPVNLLGISEASYNAAGQISFQGANINLIPFSLSPLSTPPACDPAETASVSLRDTTIGLVLPSVMYNGAEVSAYLSFNPSTYVGTVDFSQINLIGPLSASQGQQGAVAATWDLYAAMNFYAMASVAYDTYVLQFNGGPFSCTYGGTLNATYNSASGVSSITATNCAGTPFASCSGTMSVSPLSSFFPFQLLNQTAYVVQSQSLTCTGQYSAFSLDLSYTDSADVITPTTLGLVHVYSGSFEGPLNFSGFTAPLSSTVQNLSSTVSPPASDGSIELFNVTGEGFDQCLGEWFGIEPDTDVSFQTNGVLSGNVDVQMPEIMDNMQASIFSDGTLAVITSLSSSGFSSTTYPNIAAFFLNCAGI